MIVYFSGTGNSRFVAEKIAEQAGHGLFDAALGMREEEGKMFPVCSYARSTCRPLYCLSWNLSNARRSRRVAGRILS